MIGTLACHECALHTPWSCLKDHRSFEEEFVEGHIRAVHEGSDKPKPTDFDAWSQVGVAGSHSYAVIAFPWSGLVQGSEAYLRRTARRRGVDTDVARQLQRVLAEWDALTPLTNDRLSTRTDVRPVSLGVSQRYKSSPCPHRDSACG